MTMNNAVIYMAMIRKDQGEAYDIREQCLLMHKQSKHNAELIAAVNSTKRKHK